MTIEAKIIADSVGEHAPRLTTFQLRYPRFIHAEVMTHRVFSRNASSSRAIPVERLIDDILRDTAMPIHWGRNQPGMQAREEQTALVGYGPISVQREIAWNIARNNAFDMARALHDAGYHKQVVNRLLEPFAHINVVLTATDFDNFYHLRRHADAQPEIKALADAMWEAQQASEPEELAPGEWHLPYVREDDFEEVFHASDVWDQEGDWIGPWNRKLIKISVARCARVSYLTHDGKAPSITADLALYDRLVGGDPLHASPAEHQSTPDREVWDSVLPVFERGHLRGNLSPGWIQYRKTLPGERCTNYEVEVDG